MELMGLKFNYSGFSEKFSTFYLLPSTWFLFFRPIFAKKESSDSAKRKWTNYVEIHQLGSFDRQFISFESMESDADGRVAVLKNFNITRETISKQILK